MAPSINDLRATRITRFPCLAVGLLIEPGRITWEGTGMPTPQNYLDIFAMLKREHDRLFHYRYRWGANSRWVVLLFPFALDLVNLDRLMASGALPTVDRLESARLSPAWSIRRRAAEFCHHLLAQFAFAARYTDNWGNYRNPESRYMHVSTFVHEECAEFLYLSRAENEAAYEYEGDHLDLYEAPDSPFPNKRPQSTAFEPCPCTAALAMCRCHEDEEFVPLTPTPPDTPLPARLNIDRFDVPVNVYDEVFDQ
jgi:hypothetical protein